MENNEMIEIIKIYHGRKVVYLVRKYDYRFENGVLTIYETPYTENEGVVTIL